MKKMIWLLLGGAFLWIAVDFTKDMIQQNEQQQILPAETEEISSSSSTRNSSSLEESEDTSELTSESQDAEEKQETEENLSVVETPEFEPVDEYDFPASTKMTIGSNPGQTAYDFELEDMEGNLVRLSDFKGQKVFLNFWASWCPPCKVEMPHLQEFSEMQDDVAVLGVNVTVSETHPENIPAFLDEFGITFQNVYGEPIQFDQYRTQSLPTSYFIGSDGVIYDRVIGPVTTDVLQTRFDMID